MPTNQFITSDIIAKRALAELSFFCPLLMTSSRYYEQEFINNRYTLGQTIGVKKQNFFEVGDGEVAAPQAIKDRVENITINHLYHVMMSYTARQMTLDIDDLAEQAIRPAMQELAAKIENGLAQQAVLEAEAFTGTPGTALNSYNSIARAQTKLLEKNVDLSGGNAYQNLTLADAQALCGGQLTNFTPMLNDDIVKSMTLGNYAGFDLFRSQAVYRHTAGVGPVSHSGDTLQVDGAVSSGNTIVFKGATGGVTNYFVAGDKISIANVSSVYPRGRMSTNQDMQFTITSAANSTGGGAVTITVSPSIISDGSDPLRNVSNVVPNNAVVTPLSSFNGNIAYVPRALDIICPPLEPVDVVDKAVHTDPKTKLSITVEKQGIVRSGTNELRINILLGSKWHPDYYALNLS